tara:strand:+ start:649 stop:912 length:264 start_codon:yes stop_codon:yes gene_type:complete
MPKGTYNDPKIKCCKICKTKLRPLKNDDFPNRQYHISCWKTLLMDIKHFQKRAYTNKYNYKKLVAGVTEEECRKKLANGEKILMTFD